MRKIFKHALLEILKDAFLAARKERGLTQKQMSELLMMDQHSYGLLESGKTFSSALTLILYLVFLCPDVDEFVNRLRKMLESMQK